MRRSNRLILLIGVILAIVAFVLVLILATDGQDPTTPAQPTVQPTVFAVTSIPAGTRVTAEMIELKDWPIPQRAATAFNSETLVIGRVIRRNIVPESQLTAADFSEPGGIGELDVPTGLRGIAVQVDQVTGVGTVIKTGDYVDMVVGITDENFPIISVSPADDSITIVAGLNNTSVKLLLQGMQVLGTLLPPPATQQGEPADDETALTGQQQLVILAVTAQQAEVIKFAQMDGDITLILRALDDFADPANPPAIDETTGITLKVLVDEYGVLVPELVEALILLPEPVGP